MGVMAIIVVFVLLEYLVFGALVSWARMKYKVDAPATTGHPMFERYYRIHQNTMEALIVFVPASFFFARFVNVAAAAALSALFFVARIIYAVGYLKDPAKRVPGSVLTLLINAALVIGALVGLFVRATA